ncbi:MAG TPA: transposase [Planctomycetaceae bacterium]|nr:transposase [Planctomycetaceae bacterium]
MNQERISRRNLPHWYMPGAMHFITFRLAGTIPNEVLERLYARKVDLLNRPNPGESKTQHRERVHKHLFQEYDAYLDRNREIHWLEDPRVASLVRRSLYYWHGRKYALLCWCIMSNHVHVLLQPLGSINIALRDTSDVGESDDSRSPLAEIMHSLKSYTAHEANKLLRRSGSFWQHESYDHWIRDEDELERIVEYINANPISAGFDRRSHEYLWCAAHDRFLYDGDTSGWLCEQASAAAKLPFRG